MAKRSSRPRRKRRTNYKFYRIYNGYGTVKLDKEEFPLFVREFIQEYRFLPVGMDPRNPLFRDCIWAGYANKFCRLLDSIPVELRPMSIELRTPVGEPLRRWSRNRSWNIPQEVPKLLSRTDFLKLQVAAMEAAEAPSANQKGKVEGSHHDRREGKGRPGSSAA